MSNIRKQFEFDIKINGLDPMKFMAALLEKNERQELDINRGKLDVALLKQMNNRSRLLLDASKYELKRMQFEQGVAN